MRSRRFDRCYWQCENGKCPSIQETDIKFGLDYSHDSDQMGLTVKAFLQQYVFILFEVGFFSFHTMYLEKHTEMWTSIPYGEHK